MSDYFSGPVKDGDSSNLILTKIWYWMFKTAAATGGGTSGGTSGTQRTLTSTAATGSGSVAAGSKSVAFVTSSDWSGNINGVAFPASASKNISVISAGDTLPAIDYTRSAGTLYIDVLT